MTTQEAATIERSVLAHIHKILVDHKIYEALIVFPIYMDRKHYNVSCSHMKPPTTLQTGTAIEKLSGMCKEVLRAGTQSNKF